MKRKKTLVIFSKFSKETDFFKCRQTYTVEDKKGDLFNFTVYYFLYLNRIFSYEEITTMLGDDCLIPEIKDTIPIFDTQSSVLFLRLTDEEIALLLMQ